MKKLFFVFAIFSLTASSTFPLTAFCNENTTKKMNQNNLSDKSDGGVQTSYFCYSPDGINLNFVLHFSAYACCDLRDNSTTANHFYNWITGYGVHKYAYYQKLDNDLHSKDALQNYIDENIANTDGDELNYIPDLYNEIQHVANQDVPFSGIFVKFTEYYLVWSENYAFDFASGYLS